MSVELNHTIVHSRDKQAGAAFLAAILNVEVQPQWGPFVPVTLANGVTLDYMDSGDVRPQHYAFLVSEHEFDAAYARLRHRRARIWADPDRTRPGEINRRFGGRGVYFDDPDGHLLEILTRPYEADAA